MKKKWLAIDIFGLSGVNRDWIENQPTERKLRQIAGKPGIDHPLNALNGILWK